MYCKLLTSTFFIREKYKSQYFINLFEAIMNFYAVAHGRNSGIYTNWNDCKTQVDKFSCPVFKKFKSEKEAENFMKQYCSTSKNDQQTSLEICSNLLPHVKTVDNIGKIHLFQQTDSLRKMLLSNSDNNYNQPLNKSKLEREKYNENTDEFLFDKDGYTEVYTDGSCMSNGNSNAKAGIGIWFSHNNSLNISQPVVGRATNNMAEIQAVTIAAKQAQKVGIEKLKIYTDSQFLISCITKWMPKWKKQGWQTSSGKNIVNKVELIEMEKALAPLKVKWSHVKGHDGIYGNEMADKLARLGSEAYKKTE